MSRDKIQLKSMVFHGFHGVAAAEQELGQRFVVDLEVERSLRAAGLSDNLSDTVSYAHLFRAAREVVEGPSRRLLENLAEAIATAVLERFDVDSVRVRVMKPSAPIRGAILDHAGVEIYRERESPPA